MDGGNIVKTPPLVINLSAERTKRHCCLKILVTLPRLLVSEICTNSFVNTNTNTNTMMNT